MVNLEITREGYEGIPAVERTMTEEELRQWVASKDATLIPHAVAALKKAQEGIAVTSVSAIDADLGTPVGATLTLNVGDEIRLKGIHEPAESTAASTWTSSASTKIEAIVDPNDERVALFRALKPGQSTLKCTCGAGSVSITATVQ